VAQAAAHLRGADGVGLQGAVPVVLVWLGWTQDKERREVGQGLGRGSDAASAGEVVSDRRGEADGERRSKAVIYRVTCADSIIEGHTVTVDGSVFTVVLTDGVYYISPPTGGLDSVITGEPTAIATAIALDTSINSFFSNAIVSTSDNGVVTITGADSVTHSGASFEVEEDMAAEATLIAGIRNRGITATAIGDVALASLLTGLLGEYARQRPVIAATTFETVADQAAYAWDDDIGDADGIEVLKCLWSRGYGLFEWQSILWPIDALGFDYHRPSERMIEQMKMAEALKASQGSAYQNAPCGDVYLTPAPTESGIEVYLLYTKPYDSLDELPVVDYDIFLDMAEWKLSEYMVKTVIASGMAAQIKTPEYELNLGTQIGTWRANGKEKHQSFVDKCAAGKAAVARS
jgi:hypothetical protein